LNYTRACSEFYAGFRRAANAPRAIHRVMVPLGSKVPQPLPVDGDGDTDDVQLLGETKVGSTATR